MRTRPFLIAFATAAGAVASFIAGADTAHQEAVIESVHAPARVAKIEPLVVTSTTVVPIPTTAAPAPAAKPARPVATTAAPRQNRVIDDSHRDDGVTIELADNAGFFTVGEGPGGAGSATTADGDDDDKLTFYAYCGSDEARALICRATLTNNSDTTVRFDSGLIVSFEVTPRGGSPIMLAGYSDVAQLAPGETVELRTTDSRTLDPGTYDYTASASVVW